MNNINFKDFDDFIPSISLQFKDRSFEVVY